MPFRDPYSKVENQSRSRAESSVLTQIVINGFPLGRIQGLQGAGQAANQPMTELGTDRAVEFVPGIKIYNGSFSSATIRYGDMVKRLAAVTGTKLTASSKASILSDFPEFDIQVVRAGNPTYPDPALYPLLDGNTVNLSGAGDVIKEYIGCSITNFSQSFQSQQAMIMEQVSFQYIDEIYPIPATPEAD